MHTLLLTNQVSRAGCSRAVKNSTGSHQALKVYSLNSNRLYDLLYEVPNPWGSLGLEFDMT